MKPKHASIELGIRMDQHDVNGSEITDMRFPCSLLWIVVWNRFFKLDFSQSDVDQSFAACAPKAKVGVSVRARVGFVSGLG